MNGQVTESGLRLADGRELAWSEVYFVDWTARDARLATAAGVVTVSRADGQRAEVAIAPWESVRDTWAKQAPEHQRRDWAALPDGSEVVSRQTNAPTLVVGMLWGLAAMFVAFGLFTGERILLGLFGFFAVLLGGLAWWLGRRTVGPRITRLLDGLRCGRLFASWADLRALGERRMPTNDNLNATHLILLTRAGRLVIKGGYGDGAAMRWGLRRAMADRQAAVPADAERGRFSPSLTRPGEGLWLDHDGLTIVGARGVRRVGWPQLGAPEWLASGARLRAGEHRLKLTDYMGGEALGLAIDARRGDGGSLTDERGALRPAVIERWLGVKPGGALRCGLSPWAVWGCGLGALALTALVLVALYEGGRVAQGLQGVVMALAAAGAARRSARAVVADAQGLTVRRGKRRETYAWSAIDGLGETQYEWIISTEDGLVNISKMATGRDQVIGIVKRLLAAKEAGLALPDQAPLPDVALSLARDTGLRDAERGLSVSTED